MLPDFKMMTQALGLLTSAISEPALWLRLLTLMESQARTTEAMTAQTL
jgi:hypothetical protein